MKNKLLQTLIFCSTCIFTFAQSIIGLVTNTANKPIVGCVITIESRIIGQTNDTGFFFIDTTNRSNKFIRFSFLGYKEKYLSLQSIFQNTRVILQDSTILLPQVVIDAKVYKQKLVGDSTKHKMKGEYGVACGGLLASEIKLVQKAFYLNELSFYLIDYKLPKNKSNLKISITSCHTGKENKATQTNYSEPFYPVLDEKKTWYTVKLDSTNKKKIESNCIAVKFEVKCDFTEEQQSVIPRNREAFVIFGRAKKAQEVFSWCTDMLFQSAIVGYDNTIPYSQRVFLKITETEK